MMISEEEKKEIRKKYEDNVSKEVLNHLKRHFPVTQHDWTINNLSPMLISVNDHQYWIEGHKKFLVNKISSIVEESFPTVEKSTLRRTVKYYLDLTK